MKTGVDAVLAVLNVLDDLRIPYMLVGSFSSNFYGVARSTKDADLVVLLNNEDRKSLLAKLPTEFRIDPQVSFEMVTGTTRQILEVPSVPFTIELFDLSSDSYDQERFQRRVSRTTMGRQVSLPRAEDVIVQKLRWCHGGKRSKDFNDAVCVIAIQNAELDWNYIRKWCGLHETLDLLDQARKEALPPTAKK